MAMADAQFGGSSAFTQAMRFEQCTHKAHFPGADTPRVSIQYAGRTATSSGHWRRKPWVLRGEPAVRPPIDRLMGWSGDADPHSQIELRFATRDEAMAFARRRGWLVNV
jgi:hypothetical protein